MLLCDSGVDVSSSLLLASAILMAVREQLFHSSRCLNFRNRLTILLGNGDGTLQMPIYHTVAIPANSIAVGDFNNDNKPDIAVIGNTNNNGTNTVSILTNPGASFTEHSFTAPTYFTANGFGADADFVQYLVAGDFNGDGRIDLAYV